MTQKQYYMLFNIPKVIKELQVNEQELLLRLLCYDENKEELSKYFGITTPTLSKRIKSLKKKMYDKCSEGYMSEEDIIFEKVKEFISSQNKGGTIDGKN